MGEVITLVPKHNYTMSIARTSIGYYCAWSVNGEVVWQFESEDLDGIRVFFDSMIGRIDDTGTPLQGA
jgi:hypothetical protein